MRTLAFWPVLLGAASAAPLKELSHFGARSYRPACVANASTVAGRSLSGEVCRAAFRSPCGAMPFVSTPLLTSGLVATRAAVAPAAAHPSVGGLLGAPELRQRKYGR